MTFGEKIIDKLVEDNGDQIKIAFLPYKYSMWDSLETVYDAAVQKGLTTYLMPLVYMTRGDGKWHDETPLFGNNTDDRAVLKTLKPDFVVIHNPYDGNNKVTSIDPNFYSEQLKKAGFKIVYLAYCGSCWGETFILQDGVKNADYIFVKTEDERQRYIDLWMKKGVDKSKKVFCVGGLPKYEAIHKKRVYPDCFQREQKRIVLVAGSLVSFIKDPDERLRKWADIIMKFAENDENSVVFRPHPLMNDMINAMYKQYRLKYDDFLTKIQQYCIIDDSEYFQNAVKLADYLASDPSSVIDVWKQTGKDYEVIE